MGIVMQTPQKAVEAYLNAVAEKVDKTIIDRMCVFGTQCVNKVRDRNKQESWIDHTGNLRSSIGFSVLRGKEVVDIGGFYPTNAPKGNGREGQQEGRNYMEREIALCLDDYTLLIVAGMEYASKVEAIESKDVLASIEIWAKQTWAKSLPNIKKSITNEINKLAKEHGLL